MLKYLLPLISGILLFYFSDKEETGLKQCLYQRLHQEEKSHSNSYGKVHFYAPAIFNGGDGGHIASSLSVSDYLYH